MTAFTPMPLNGTREIKQAFHVGDDSVRQWIEEGAPIVRLKNSVHTEYNMLLEWLLERHENDFFENSGNV